MLLLCLNHKLYKPPCESQQQRTHKRKMKPFLFVFIDFFFCCFLFEHKKKQTIVFSFIEKYGVDVCAIVERADKR